MVLAPQASPARWPLAQAGLAVHSLAAVAGHGNPPASSKARAGRKRDVGYAKSEIVTSPAERRRMGTASLEAALGQFEATEANLQKLESLWAQIRGLIGEGIGFVAPPGYDDACRAFRHVLPGLPAIDGVRPEDRLLDYTAVGQMRMDAAELGFVDAEVSVSNQIELQGKMLEEYRFRFETKRRELIRGRMTHLVDEVDNHIRLMASAIYSDPSDEPKANQHLAHIDTAVSEIGTLLGSTKKPLRWEDLLRHIRFGAPGDMQDIVRMDWPMVKRFIVGDLYGEHDPLPVTAPDLGALVAAHPTGPVSTKLNWTVLTDEDFERLMFALISTTSGYENAAWLQHTNAADRGRDLSVTRVIEDQLEGVRRQRVIIQCKHWQTKSVNATEVSAVRGQMELWQPPRVDVLIIATTGRFTVDAIDLIEKHNQTDRALAISMWADSHLERLLAARPHLIAQFKLRK
ncbi:MAG: restriction endonuclease [Planctomycetes bacterium]|nr:restriction endonuclease [Planctomycetota bacterium]